jgi:tyrosyl-tRNA synthetase
VRLPAAEHGRAALLGLREGAWRQVPFGRESLALVRMDPIVRTEATAGADRGRSTPAQDAAWLVRDAVDSLPAGSLKAKLALGRPLRVKLGIDPTAADIHLGHTVVLRKLREFQDLGHLVVLIIGDYTARVGDPSGRSSLRPMLAPEEIDRNAETFQEQAFKVLDRERIEVRCNSEWLNMSMEDLFGLARTSTVAQILERDDFAKRLAAGTPVSLLELLYPLLQGYDSVAIKADVELGGTDQKFNLLLARGIQSAYGVPEQSVLTMPILPGTDGVRRMAKSLGNYIGVTDEPDEIYGKTMSIPDAALETWSALLLGRAPDSALGPRDSKRALARELVERFHGPGAGEAAEQAFDRVHVAHQPPEEMPNLEWQADEAGVHLPALLAAAFGISTSEARRAVAQGGVRIDGEVVDPGLLDLAAEDVDGRVLQLGKRRFVRVHVV